jgi:hypothetical protein
VLASVFPTRIADFLRENAGRFTDGDEGVDDCRVEFGVACEERLRQSQEAWKEEEAESGGSKGKGKAKRKRTLECESRDVLERELRRLGVDESDETVYGAIDR